LVKKKNYIDAFSSNSHGRHHPEKRERKKGGSEGIGNVQRQGVAHRREIQRKLLKITALAFHRLFWIYKTGAEME